jgi:flavin-binding protein dodecin
VDHTLLPILYFFESLEVQMKPTIVTGAVEAQQVAFQVAFPVG